MKKPWRKDPCGEKIREKSPEGTGPRNVAMGGGKKRGKKGGSGLKDTVTDAGEKNIVRANSLRSSKRKGSEGELSLHG